VLRDVRSVSCIMYSGFIFLVCREVITVYCENRVELTHAMCAQNAGFRFYSWYIQLLMCFRALCKATRVVLFVSAVVATVNAMNCGLSEPLSILLTV